MKLEIVSRQKNLLLHREEIEFEAESKTTPRREDVRKDLAKALNAKPENLVVGKIVMEQGKEKMKGNANLYEETDILKKLELAHKIKRNFPEKKEETKKVEKKKEPEREEVKEEKKEEEKKQEKIKYEEKVKEKKEKKAEETSEGK